MSSGERRLAVFDFDGTLANTVGDIVSSLNEARAELDIPPAPAEVVRTWIGEGVEHLVTQALPPERRTAAARADILQRYRTIYARRMFETAALYPGVPECLQALAEAGVVLAVCSNKGVRFVEGMIEFFGMQGIFARVVGGDSLPMRKPDGRVLEHIADGLRAVRGNTWMIGDSAIDVLTGKAFHCRTVGCAYGIRGREELEAAWADVIVERVAEIPARVLGQPR